MTKRPQSKAFVLLALAIAFASGVESSSKPSFPLLYHLAWTSAGTVRGENPAGHLQLEFTPHGARLQFSAAEIGMGLGRDGMASLSFVLPSVSGNRVEYRQPDFTEYYRNEPHGLVHGFTILRPSARVLTIPTSGTVPPRLSPQSDAVFLNSHSRARLAYGPVRAYDARGRAVPVRLAVHAWDIRLVLDDSDAAYPVEIESALVDSPAPAPRPLDAAPGPYLISTFAGGLPTATPATASRFPLGPTGTTQPPTVNAVATDPYGNLYLSSTLQCVFKVDSGGNITRVAGTCHSGFSGDGGPALAAQLNQPVGLAADAAGNLYIADSFNNRVRKVSSTGVITTIAGNGTAGYSGDNGPATAAELNDPQGLALDGWGNLYVADQNNQCIRVVSSTGVIQTAAGIAGSGGYSGDGQAATGAQLDTPTGVAVDSSGNLYIADTWNNVVREVSGGAIHTVVGNGFGYGEGYGSGGYSGDGGPATAAELALPRFLAVGPTGTLYVDDNNQVIRAVSGGQISTVAGTSQNYGGDNGPATAAAFYNPLGLATDSAGNVYVADSGNNRVREFQPGGNVTTIAGNGSNLSTGDGGLAISAQLNGPLGVTTDSSGNVYVADAANSRIRKVNSSGAISTFYQTRGIPAGLASDSSGNVYVADSAFERVGKVSPSGTYTNIAGIAEASGFAGDNGQASLARLNNPTAVALDSAWNVYIGDNGNCRVRKVTVSTGVINTIAGTSTCGDSGDGGPGTSAQLQSVGGLAFDSQGNLYISDTVDYTVRKLSASSGTISTIAGKHGDPGNSGDGAAATSALLGGPEGLVVDSGGNLFITDAYDSNVRVVTPDGTIYTVAGTGTFGYSGDGGAATSALIGEPQGIAVDSSGNLYVTDGGNSVVRKLQPAAQPLLTIAATHFGNFTQGQTNASYTVTVSNAAQAGPTNGSTVTVTESLPSGLTLTGLSGSGWSCSVGSSNCTRSDALQAGNSYPITVTVSVASNAASQVSNVVSVSGGGALGANAMDVTDIGGPQDLTVTKTHNGTFAPGQSATYTITVSNVGGAATSGTVAIDDSLPAGLTATSLSGMNWNCTLGTLICTRSDPLGASSSYPAIALTVSVGNGAPNSVVNTVTVSGGGEADTSNDVATDTATIAGSPALAITKTADAASVSPGTSIGFTITVESTGGGTANSAALSDALPSGNGINWSISPAYGGPGSCTVSNLMLGCNFGSLGQGASASVHVTSGTSTSSCGTYNNTASASASNAGSVQASAGTTVACPSLTLTDTPSSSNPVLAGTAIGYTLVVKNTGTGTATSTTVTDTLPSGINWSVVEGNCSISGGILTCNLGSLAANGSATVAVSGNTSSSTCGTYTDSASVSASDANSVSANASVGVQCTTLSITDTPSSSTPVSPGTAIGYTVVVNNAGSNTAASATLTDTLPSGISWSVVEGNCSISNNILTCNLGSLAPNGSATVQVSGNTSTSTCATYTNQASASASNAPSVSQSASVTVQCPSLSVIDTPSSSTPVTPGTAIGYTVVVSNTGNGAATSATLTDTLPTGITWNVTQGNCTNSNGTLTCNLGTIAANSSATVQVTGNTSLSTCGTFTNQASASAANASTVSANASDTVQCTTLSITDTPSSSSPVLPGTAIGYTVVVNNTSGSTATSASLTDTLPAGITWNVTQGNCTNSNGTLTCSLGNLAANGSATVQVSGNTSLSTCGTYTNQASASASNAASVSQNASVTVQCTTLSITETPSSSTPVSPGTAIGYTVVVSNTGSNTAVSATLTDTLPSGISWSVVQGNCTTSNNTLTCNLGSLAPNNSATVQVTGNTSTSTCATYTNQASAGASNAPSVSQNASVTVQCPSLSITDTPSSTTPVTPGTAIGYTVVISNTGNGAAKSATLTDTLPSGINWSVVQGNCTASNGTLTCNLGDLAANSTATVQVTGNTSTSTCATYTNQATASASNAGSVSANASITVQCSSLSITDTPSSSTPVSPGTAIGYTVVVSNTGNGTATSASLTDTLPSGITWSVVQGSNCTISSGTLTCPLSLSSNSSATVQVTGSTSLSTCGTYTNQATASASNASSVSANASVTVQCTTLSITDTPSSSTPVTPGTAIGYTVVVNNTGSATATSTTLTDTLPSGISWSVVQGNCTTSNSTLMCNLGSLATNSSATVQVTGNTSSSTCATYTNQASAGATNATSVSANASVTVQCPSLSITDTPSSSTPVTPGTAIGYTVVVSNTGNGAATSATLTDTLPSGITWTVTQGSNCTISSGTLSCPLTLPANSSATVQVSGNTSTSTCATYTNQATASASNANSVSQNASVTVQCPTLSITDTPSSSTPVTAGTAIGYTMVVSNTGNGSATSATLTDTLPSGITWSVVQGSGCTLSSGTLTCPLTLPSNSTATVQVTGNTSTSTCATYTNQATASASNATSVSQNASITVQCPTLSITDTPSSATPVTPGTAIGYTVVVSNTGNGAATSATLTDTLPSGIGWTVVQGNCTTSNSTLTCNLGSLATNSSATVQVTGNTSASTCATYTNQASAVATNASSVSQNASVTVQCPTLSITDTPSSSTPVTAGTAIGYTMVVSNTGNGSATSATLTDTLPSGITWSVVQGSGCTLSSGTLTCPLTLPSNSTATVQVTGNTSTSTCATYTNQATASASNATSVSQNASITVQCPTLSITDTPSSATPVTPGTAIGYTVVVSNTGNGAATSATLTDTLPSGISWTVVQGNCTTSNSTLTCNLGSLATNSSATVQVTGNTSASTCATYTNQASAVATNASSVSQNASVTVQCPTLSITDTPSSSTPVTAGTAIGYTMVVSNTGNGSATSATLTDTLPSGITWSVVQGSGCTLSSGTLSCPLTLPSNSTATVQVTGNTSTSTCATYTNQATASASNASSVSANASVTVQCPTLSITDTPSSATPVTPDTAIGYTVVVSNTGNGAATSATLTDTLPSGITWSVVQGSNCTISGGTLTCPLTLPSNSTATVKVTGNTSTSTCATYTNQATASASNASSVSANASVTVQCPSLSITDTPSSTTPVTPGTAIGYTVVVSNTGNGAATSATLTDTLPTGITWTVTQGSNCTISSGTLSCPLTLPANSSATVQVSGNTSTSTCATYTNQATASASNASSVSANSNVTVQCPSLSITDTPSSSTPVTAGTAIGYTVVVSNTGNGSATSATLTDTLPSGITWSVVQGSGCTLSSGTLTCPLTLPSNSTATVQVTGNTSTSTCATYTNQATASASNATSVSQNAGITVQCPSLSITDTPSSSTPVTAGTAIGYTVVVSNTGNGAATLATLTDTLPSGISWTVVQGNCTTSNSTLTCNLGSLATNSSATFQVTGNTSTSTCATYTNQATGSATNATSVSQSASVTVQCPSLSIIDTPSSSTPVSPGTAIGYTVVVSNTGNGAATSATLTDTLPNGITWSVVQGSNCTISSGTLSCPLTLPANSSATVQVSGNTSTSTCATYTNQATAIASNASSVSANASVTVQCPSLSITDTPSSLTPITAGTAIGYTMVVSNTGNGSATSATLTDTLPSGISWTVLQGNCTASNSTLTCNLGNIGVNNSATVQVTGNTSTSTCATYTNQATASASNASSVSANASVTVQCPSLSITDTPSSSTPVTPGTAIGYTVVVSNTGNGAATSATLTDTLPSGITWSVVQGSGCTLTSGTLTCPLTLPSNSTATVQVTGNTSTSTCATYTNQATASASNATSVSQNASITVQCPTLSITDTPSSATPVTPGTAIGYTVVVSNTANGAASSATLTDTLPTGITWSVVQGSNCTISSGTLTCPLTLPSNSSATVQVTGNTSTSTCATYTNQATASASNATSVSQNASITVQCPSISITDTPSSATPVTPGTAIGYTVVVSNTGNGAAASATLTDTLPTGITWNVVQGSSCTISSGTLSCPLTLPANSTAMVQVSGNTSTSTCATYTNQATASASNASSVSANASVTVQCPSLSITDTPSSSTPVTPGTAIGYTLVVSNTGNGAATSATLTDTLPNGITWSVVQGSSCTISSGTLTCPLTLPSNSSATVQVTGNTSTSTCATYTNQATASASNASSVSGNASVTVQCPTLSITDTPSSTTPVTPGTAIGYTMVVNNTGNGAATSATLTDTLPTGITWTVTQGSNCNISSGTLTCPLTLPSNSSATVQVTGNTSTSTCATYTNQATASASNASGVSGNASVTVQCPTLSITDTPSSITPVTPGTAIGYTVVVSNTGNGAATSGTLTDTLPTGIAWTVTQGSNCNISSGTLTCPLTLPSNSSATVQVTGNTSTSTCGTYTNQATASATNATSVSANAGVTVQCPSLSITDTPSASTPVSPGTAIGYTVVVSNTGNGAVTSATLADTLPSGIAWTVTQGSNCSISSGTLTCPLTLPANSSATVQVTGNTSSSTCATYTNQASASATNASSVSANASVTVQCPSLSITDTPSSSTPVTPGTAIGYTMVVSNTGNGAATWATLTDTLPTGIAWTITQGSNCNISGGTLTCPLTLPANSSATVQVTSNTSTSTCATFTNQATASATNASSVSANASVTVQCPSLSIQESQQGAFIQGESGATYLITVTNGSALTATSGTVTVTVNPASGLQLVSLSGSGWTCPPNGNFCYRNDALPPGSSYLAITATFNVSASASPPLGIQFSVSGGGSAAAMSTGTAALLVFTCAITGDSAASVADVQLIVNEALGLAPPANDLNQDNTISVVDIQKVVNAVLGLGCLY